MMNGHAVAASEYPERGLHGRVVHRLGSRIVSGAIPPGTVLPIEDELGAELGVSRSILREAVKVLVGKGLLEVRPKVGTRVRPRRSWHLLDLDVVRWQFEQLREEDVQELVEIWSAIAPTAARLAAERRNEEDLATMTAHVKRMEAATAEPIAFRAAELDFHTAVVDSAHNALLSHVGAIMRVSLGAAVAQLAVGGSAEPADPIRTDDRWAIVDAISKQESAAAEQAMLTLLRRTLTKVKKDK